jgi:Fe-S-cluster containining protein
MIYVEDSVAVITLDSQNPKISDISIVPKLLHFKCKRCASLCCNLGGPAITQKDVELIQSTNYCVSNFFEPLNRNQGYSSIVVGQLKNKSDGSCIFFKSNATQNCHSCCIYPIRPALCKLYPFTFERHDSKKIVLKIIPCCLGLNSSEGELITEKFISKIILEPLLEAMTLFKK